MAAIVTTNMRVYAAQQFISGFSDSDKDMYLFIGRTLPWTGTNINDNTPPAPVDCQFDESAAYRDMLSAKKIDAASVNLVAPRFNWTQGTVYTQYQNNIDLFDPSSGLPPFFVITDDLNVYKCINNGASIDNQFTGAASTVKPTGTITTAYQTADGYQWKYMFTVSSSDVLKFVTDNWIPVKTLTANNGSDQWLVQQAAVPGTIDRIDMESIGSQYTNAPTVSIVGDGSGATAAPYVLNGNVQRIIVTNPGSGYTWANVEITGGGVGANGAAANAVVSPFAGHGADAIQELGAFFVLVNSKLTYDENNTFTVLNDFRRVGIWMNPLLNNGGTQAVGLDYQQMTRLSLNTISGNGFEQDEIVTGLTSLATGVVVDYDSNTMIVRLVETAGSFIPGETVSGETSSTTGVLQTTQGTVVSATSSTVVLANSASASDNYYNGQSIRIKTGQGVGQVRTIIGYAGLNRTATISPNWSTAPNGTSTYSIANILAPDLKQFSGKIVYLENRRPITRSSDQVEDIKIVVEF